MDNNLLFLDSSDLADLSAFLKKALRLDGRQADRQTGRQADIHTHR